VDYLLHATARAEERHFWFRGFRAFVVPLVRRALRGVAHPQILDCGCGTGATLELLARFGDAYGFDLSATGLQFGREAGRTRLALASIASAPFPDEAFDLVTSFDVLVTLPAAEERAAAREMFRMTRPGGYVLVNVAALSTLRGDHSVLSHERRRYNRGTLGSLLTGAGLVPVRMTYTNTTLTPPLYLLRAFQRWRGLRPEAEAQREITVPPAPLNGVLTAILVTESLWIRRVDMPFGSSLLCLARRPS
jgi:SAM-dependent methyltransferase